MQNSVLGSSAGTAITTANNATLIGYNAGQNITTAGGTTIVGSGAGQNITSNSNNTAFGYQGLYALTSGQNNIALGFQAGRYYGGSTSNLLQVADNSILIGYQAYAGGNSQTNQIVIGYQTTGLGSNTTVIGNSSTTVTGLYGNLLLVGSGSANLMTGSATGSGYTLNIAGPSTSGSLYSNGFSVFDGTISGSQPANNVSSSLILISGSINPTGSAGTGSAVLLNTTLSASANNQALVGLDINPTFNNGAFTGVSNYGVRIQKTALFNDTWANGQAYFGSLNQGGKIAFVDGYNGSLSGTLGFNSANNINPVLTLTTNAGGLTLSNTGGGTTTLSGQAQVVVVSSNNSLGPEIRATGAAARILINSQGASGTINFNTSATQNAQVFSTGNWLLQNGGTFTDNGYKLQLQGSGSASGSLYVNGFTVHDGAISGSQPANNVSSSLILISGSINPTGSAGTGSVVLLNTVISASANNQTLVGLDLNPTFATTGFTGTTSAALRVGGNIIPNANTTYNIGTNSLNFTSIYVQNINTGGGLNINVGALGINSGGTAQITAGGQIGLKASNNTLFTNNNIQNAQVFSTGNWLLQNGGTFTDNGARLQISGSIQASGNLARAQTIGTTLSASANSDNLIGLDIAPNYAGGVGSTNTISNAGSGYATGSYTLVPLTGGNGTGATASIVASGSITSVTVTTAGSGYYLGDVLSASNTNLGGAGSGFTYTVNTLSNSNVRNIGLRVDGISIGRGGGYVSSNTVVGVSAGQNNTIGAGLVAIGYQAGVNNTTGGNNVFMGYQAGYFNTGGGANIAIGATNLINNTTGNSNIAIGGQQVLSAITTANNNVAIGFQGFISLTSGNNNTLLGSSAGRYIADGVTALTSASNGIYLGGSVRAGVNGETNAIVIGTNAIGNGSNTTVIGNSSTISTALYGNLVLGGNLITGSATGSGYTLNIAGPSTNGSLLVSGSTVITGSLTVTQGITGSITSASYALSSSYAQTASFATNFTASNALITGTLTAQTLVVSTISASVEYSSGSNIFGNSLINTQQLTGSVGITGSLTLFGNEIITGSSSALYGYTGSLFGTASQAISASYAGTASVLLGSVVSASYAATASSATTFTVGGATMYYATATNPGSSTTGVHQIATGSFTSAFYNYTLSSVGAASARTGQILAVWSGSTVQYTDNSTIDIGTTSVATNIVTLSGGQIALSLVVSNATAWIIKTSITYI